jgi:hypothetical protein
MAIEKQVHDDGAFAVARVFGVVTAEEIIDFQFWLINAFNSGTLQKNYRLLIDARDVEIIQVDEKDIHRLSQINTVYGRQRGRLRTAIAVDSGPGRQLAQLHKTLSKNIGIEVEIFEMREHACTWLGIDPMAGAAGMDDDQLSAS